MPSIQTLPPELLLHTISFLPTSALLPLTRTSHYLHTFISTHASSICNTHITTHYSLEAAVLHPVLKNGWLVPTLPGVRETCKKYCEQPLGSLHKERMMRWGKKMKLSEPGPQFLRFLELYGRDIRVRVAMEITAVHEEKARIDELEDNEKPLSKRRDFEKMGIDEVVKNLRSNERFEGAISMYCITPFMSSIARCNHEFGRRDFPPQTRATKLKSIKRCLESKLKNMKEKAQDIFKPSTSDTSSDTSLLFGEVLREKSRIEVMRQESVGEGMLWYYGRTGVAPLEERAELGKFWKISRCAKDVRGSFGRAGKSVGRAVRGWRCGGGFEVLE